MTGGRLVAEIDRQLPGVRAGKPSSLGDVRIEVPDLSPGADGSEGVAGAADVLALWR